jgi:hypothetical protein
MEERVPEAFFTVELASEAAVLLRKLSPPAKRVLLCHLDAPGWAIVDLDDPSAKPKREPIPSLASVLSKAWSGEPLISAPRPRQVDHELALSATDYDDRLSWEWEPAPRCTVHGWFPRDLGWTELRRLVSSIAPEMRQLLTYQPR